MNELIKKKIDITVLVTSLHQRDISIETVNYYSEICSEVIFVDEQQPYLAETDIHKLRKKNINYITYKDSDHKRSIKSVYQKRLIACNHSSNNYVVHSNHDERYTCNGLLRCVAELKKDESLVFCSGQAVAVRKKKSKIYYTRSYEKLDNYHNTNNLEERLYNHSKTYSPIAHYSVWKKQFYINVTQNTISLHGLVTASGYCDEVIFELIADIAGKSKALPELYWIRNRVNPPGPKHKRDQGVYSFKIVRDKLNILLKDHNNIHIDVIMKYLYKSFNTVRSKTLLYYIFLSIKWAIYRLTKKEIIDDIEVLLNKNKIIYNKADVLKALNSMNLQVKRY